MKRETLRHPKTYDLCSRLGCSRPEALGLLTLLWDFTAEFSPEGSVGRFADGSIERSCDWTGEPGRFISALLASGWLDEHPVHRLVIHDWADHCEQWIRLKLAKLGRKFAVERSPVAFTVASTVASTKPSPPRDPNPNQSLDQSLDPAQQTHRASPFTPPSLDEVSDYCRERGNGIDPQAFIDYYQVRDWKPGNSRTRMKCWRAAIRTWEKRTNGQLDAKAARAKQEAEWLEEFSREEE